MHREAFEDNLCLCRIKVFIFHASLLTAVYSIAEIGSKAGNVKVIGSFADFLVRRKGDADFSVGKGVGDETLYHGHDLGDARLVVGAQQRRAVRRDERLSFECRQVRKVGYAEGDPISQGQITAVVILGDDRIDRIAGKLRGGVHVGDKPHGGNLVTVTCGVQGCVNVPIGIHLGMVDAKGKKLVHQGGTEGKLSGRAGGCAGGFIAGGTKGNVMKKTLISLHGNFLFVFHFST